MTVSAPDRPIVTGLRLPGMSRRALLSAAAATTVTVGVLQAGRRRPRDSPTAQVTPPPPTATPPAAAPVTTALTLTSTPVLTLDHDIGDGMTGDDVRAVQQRLTAIGFDPGPDDGAFGPATKRAVWAFEKLLLGTARNKVTGVVTNDTWQAMNDAATVTPRRSLPGTHLEVLLPEQVAVLYIDDTVRLITHISSGSGDEWCQVVTVDHDDGTQTEEGICGRSITPGGVFHFDGRFIGWRESKLGRLYNPVYFNYGLAVHGASKVPAGPASHGCVRIPMHIAEYFPSLVADGDQVYVFDGVKEPEIYGAQPPVFDWPDPNYTPPSTSTTVPEEPSTTTRAATTSSAPATTQPEPHQSHPTTTSAPTPIPVSTTSPPPDSTPVPI